MRRLLPRLALSLFVLVLCLGAVEAVLRAQGYGKQTAVWFDAHVGTRFHPSQTREIFGPGMTLLSKARINAQGYRGPDFDDPAHLAERRILCLGDSFTFGWGVEDDESYPVVLQERIDALPGGGDWQVLNAGMPGYNTWQQLQLYTRELKDTQPEVVVVGWYLNDLDPYSIGASGALQARDHWLAGTASLDWYLKKVVKPKPKFQFANLEAEPLREAKAYYDQNRDLVEHNSGHPDARPYVERNLEHLGQLFDAIRESGAKPLLLIFPSVGQMDALKAKRAEGDEAAYLADRAIVARIQTDLTEFAASREVPVVDLLDAYMDSSTRPYGEVDQSHPSVHGHVVAAEAVLAALQGAGVLPAQGE